MFDNIHGGHKMMQIVDISGHKLKEISLVQITYCSVCQTLINWKAYRCQVCKVTVHSNCHTQIEKKCAGNLYGEKQNKLLIVSTSFK